MTLAIVPGLRLTVPDEGSMGASESKALTPPPPPAPPPPPRI